MLLIRNYRTGEYLKNLNLSIHLHDDEIEPHFVRSKTSLAVKFHTGCDLEEFIGFLKSHLAESEWKAFLDLWSNDEQTRCFVQKTGYLIISY